MKIIGVSYHIILLDNNKQIRKFKSQWQAQQFLSCLGVVNNLFRFGHHLLQAKHYRAFRDHSFSERDRVSCAPNLD